MLCPLSPRETDRFLTPTLSKGAEVLIHQRGQNVWEERKEKERKKKKGNPRCRQTNTEPTGGRLDRRTVVPKIKQCHGIPSNFGRNPFLESWHTKEEKKIEKKFSYPCQQVIQRRDDYGADNRENFNRDWDDYKSGFGDPDREFWLGNENIYMLTNAEDYSLRVELEDFEGNKRWHFFKTQFHWWLDFDGTCSMAFKVCRVFQLQAVLGEGAVQARDWRLHGQCRRLAQRSLVRIQPEPVLNIQSVPYSRHKLYENRHGIDWTNWFALGTTTGRASIAHRCSRAAGGGSPAGGDWTGSTWRIPKIWQPGKVKHPTVQTFYSDNKLDRIFGSNRNRLVPLARMGLHTQAGHHDDPPATLRQRALDTQSLV